MVDSRAKGRRFENEVAGALDVSAPAARISEAGLPGPDVKWLDRFWECKSRKKYESMRYYATQLEDDNHGTIFKENGGPTLVLMHLDELLDLIDEIRNA